MSTQRVVITGLGVVSPIGCDLEALWDSLMAGRSGIAPITGMPTESLPVKAGAEVKDFTGDIENYGPLDKSLQRSIKKNMKVMCREIEMGVAAAQKALTHSGLSADRTPERCGCLFGCDYILTRPEEFADGLRNCRQQAQAGNDNLAGWVSDWPVHGLPKVNPLWLLKYLPNMPNSHVSIYNDFRGPNNAITVREASMNLSLAEAASIIQRGAADVMLVGATGTRIHPLRSMHVTLTEPYASHQDDPSTMSRPFDASCDGFVLGEGAGAIMLESLEHAKGRGAKLWGEIVGFSSSMTGPAPGRDHLRQAIGHSLKTTYSRASGAIGQQWHLHAHGLSTQEADTAEAGAIADLLDSLGYQIPVTAAKSYFGNLGAGSGAIELVCSLLALQHQQLFPIRNLKRPMASVTWPAAQGGSQPGQGFIHSSFTLQGQAASIAVATI
ncbi:MAG TPA: 3-oxoacyl-ACP synthase [Planctomycetaceae bacterium]|nr:3-oxoacyl-ACP synthase [Planctomycetaceae bacterium]